MAHKKNAFLNFCFSCLPGAGQMFQGFVRRGISIMLLFFVVLMFISYGLEELSFIMPVIWFYGFFDSIHCNSLPDSEFAKIRDDYLFVHDDFGRFSLKRFRMPVAFFLIFFGAYSLLHTFINMMCRFGIIRYDSLLVNFVREMLPETVFAVVIIGIGLYLISGKARETFDEKPEKIVPGWQDVRQEAEEPEVVGSVSQADGEEDGGDEE